MILVLGVTAIDFFHDKHLSLLTTLYLVSVIRNIILELL